MNLTNAFRTTLPVTALLVFAAIACGDSDYSQREQDDAIARVVGAYQTGTVRIDVCEGVSTDVDSCENSYVIGSSGGRRLKGTDEGGGCGGSCLDARAVLPVRVFVNGKECAEQGLASFGDDDGTLDASAYVEACVYGTIDAQGVFNASNAGGPVVAYPRVGPASCK